MSSGAGPAKEKKGNFTDNTLPPPQPLPFSFLESCGKENKFKITPCVLKKGASNFNKMTIFITDIMPFFLRQLVKYYWTIKVRQKFGGNIEELKWPDAADEKATKLFFFFLTEPSTPKKPNKYKKEIEKYRQDPIDPEEKFYWSSSYGIHLDASEQKSFRDGLYHWDLLLLKNFLISYRIGTKGSGYSSLLVTEDGETQTSQSVRNKEKKIIAITKYRNIIAHSQNGYNVSTVIYNAFLAEFKTLIDFFMPAGSPDNFVKHSREKTLEKIASLNKIKFSTSTK